MKPGPKPRRFDEWFDRRGPDECWPWLGALDRDGYGQKGHREGSKRTTLRGHRFVYERLEGPIPSGAILDHLCRNRRCVNPRHLQPVSNRRNILRGRGLAAKNARKTHCKNGHEFTPENTYAYQNVSYPHGRRVCKTCVYERTRNRRG